MADQPTIDWRRTLKRRLTATAVAVFVWSCAIEARLVYLQVFERADLAARADNQHSRELNPPAKRGEILDRNGRLLAYSVDADSIYGVPSELLDAGRKPEDAVASLCDALGDCQPDERKKLVERLSKGRGSKVIRRFARPDQVKRVAALELEGIVFLKENKRYYPNRELAASLLGYTGTDNTGLAGIESTYDNLIKGAAGQVLILTDAHRRAFGRVEKPATAGATLELTIDEYLQHVAEKELQAGIEWAGAEGGSAIVMDPMTGEILAMANYPMFNPNIYNQFDDSARRNRAIQDLYEPGSTFKIVTAGAALEEKVFTPDSIIDTNPGVIRFGSRTIDEDKHHNYGVQTLKGVIVHSSNVGAVKIGLHVGAERISDYVRRFGFGRAESPDFKGESRGIVTPAARLSDSALASVSMGYQVAVTPLQMVTAASVVANGGELVVPRVVRAVIKGRQRLPVPRKVVGRVVSPEVAAELTDIMEGVVTDGTGTKSKVAGYTNAGKTGTAQKVENGRYSTRDYNVSFVGFIPSRKPEFAIIVVVDSPHKAPPYGGSVSAPIWQKIAAAALRYRGVPPNINPAPPILVARHDANASGAPVSAATDSPAVVTLTAASTGGVAAYPDLSGLSAREALHALGKIGVAARLRGTGLVVEQQPAAGSPFDAGDVVTLWLQRQSSARSTSQPAP